MRRSLPLFVVAAALAAVASWATVPPLSPTWEAKVDPWVLSNARHNDTEFLVFLRDQADLRPAAALPSRIEKGRFVLRALTELATRTQQPLLDDLAARGVAYRAYWVANMVWVRGGLDTLRAVAERDDVAHVYANPSVPLRTPPVTPEADLPWSPQTIEWNISKVQAPTVWSLGFTGQGVVVGGEDTGYDWDHPALKNQYRGWDGASADHNYNWHDAIHAGGGVCGPNSPQPCDDYGHGTHTMGTMVGDDGGTNQIGMAPGARWIGCRNMNQGAGTPATYSECFQWFIAPTDLNGNNPDPTKAPDVINNSWGCPPSEGCTDPTVLQTVVENTKAAGIVVVASAGNDGSGCSSVADPPAIYDAAFSVGATDSSDNIAGFSSRGPVTVDGSNRLKPNVSAPGVNIRSSVPGGGYQGGWNGTSMAGPHVAGMVALLLSALPQWQGQVDVIESRVEQTAVPRTTTQTCGGVPGTQIPNNTYGYGRINAYAAIQLADLAITMHGVGTPVIGADFQYQIAVQNGGPFAAAAITLTDTLPPSVEFVSSTGWCTLSANVLTCPLGTLPKDRSAELTIVVRPTVEGTITNVASVNSGITDPNPANNQASEENTVGTGTDLSVAGTATPSPVLVGSTLTYAITATNNGPSAEPSPVVTVDLPDGTAFQSASPGCSAGVGIVTCSLASLAVGADASVQVTVVPSVTGALPASATIAGALGDPSMGNNAADLSTTAVTMQPAAIAVDVALIERPRGDANGILEVGEEAMVSPTWVNPSGAPVAQTGVADTFTGPGDSVYSLGAATADYGTIGASSQANCRDASGQCYSVMVSPPSVRPAVHWDATFHEILDTAGEKTWTLHVGESFADVPRGFWAYPFIETLLHSGITAGCGGAHYCPGSTVSRWQMAVFLATALVGDAVPTSGTVPGMGDYDCSPDGTSVFADVPPDDGGCASIHYIAAQGIAAGCGGGMYCPAGLVSRWQMAVFLAGAMVGEPPVAGTVPGKGDYNCVPGGVSLFADVPPENGGCASIHYLAAQGVTAGCGGDNYCPSASLNRDQMAVFLTSAFDLHLYGP